ncbi:MAG: methylated-DNA--[protein]-cysteine S-methyltransferase [Spirochaetales bacterium]|nr:methylated-DNA--[protein]-cysteine S-methyltransferase [Spirochaetales bacterium]
MTATLYHDNINTAIGYLTVCVDEQGRVCFLFFSRSPAGGKHFHYKHDAAAVKNAVGQLSEYFAGKRKDFHLPLHPHGTPFQQKVWESLKTIPYGITASYADIAVKIGQPRAVRAVGNAAGRNPVPVIIPCHRIIRSDGSPGGYAGGIEAKKYLLNLEGAG